MYLLLFSEKVSHSANYFIWLHQRQQFNHIILSHKSIYHCNHLMILTGDRLFHWGSHQYDSINMMNVHLSVIVKKDEADNSVFLVVSTSFIIFCKFTMS